jgi:BASS family bile acid:Na+ symporter
METWFKLAPLALQISILAQVFAVGLTTIWEDGTYLFRRPKLLLNSILARNVAAPIIAIVLIKAFSFHVAVAITLGVPAVTPVPLLPKSELKAGARSKYVLGLLVSQGVLAIVLVPVTIELMDWALGAQAHFSVQLAPHLLTAGSVLLLAGALPLLLVAWKTFGVLNGNGAMLALVSL